MTEPPDDDRVIRFTRHLNASRARVWQAMADPKQVVRWWGPRAAAVTIQQMDLRPGGTWAYILHIWGTNIMCRATFRDVAEPALLSFAQDDFVAVWTLTEATGDTTDLAACFEFPTPARRAAAARDQTMMDAAQQSLDRLREHLAKS